MTDPKSIIVKAFVTKYVIGTGKIMLIPIEVWGTDSRYARDKRPGQYGSFGPGEWHTNYADALKRAEQMRSDKIASYKKSIAKLEKRVFTEPS